MRLAMEIFISPRICRRPSISCLTHSISPSAAASMRLSLATGQACSMMVSPLTPACALMRCQISSVINGMKGWARRSATSRHADQRAAGAALAFDLARSSHSTGLTSSRYQAQYSSQINS